MRAVRLARECSRDRRGFTLIEVMLALVIIGVALIPVLNLFQTATGNVVTAQRETRATFLAQARLDEVKGLGYEAINNVSRTTCPEDPDYEYAVAVELQGVAKKIAVTVYYTGGDGGERTVVLTTVRAAR
ncbi:MAG: type II secretion system protein [Thermoanaerobacterales bacterium]|nr:type II secretion system protein [Bacillota bacterium]MDI6906744.1 type II secretion system protein [Thermoanaerobacterales bacterium]